MPGVGAFRRCAMAKLRKYELEQVIHEIVDRQTYALYGNLSQGCNSCLKPVRKRPKYLAGLGILKGRITKIPENTALKVPQIGWNSLKFPNRGKLFEGIAEDSYVYFVHSYYLQAEGRRL